MAACGICNKLFKPKQLKVNCTDCSRDFHGSCANMSKNDIEYLANENLPWRCDPCAASRRSSLRLETQVTEGNITLEDVMKAINDLKKQQTNTIKEFNTSYETLNEKIDINTAAVKKQTETMESYLKQIEQLQNENKHLKEKVKLLEDRLDESEQYSRRNCVEIQGVAVQDNSVLGTVKSVGSALGMDITDSMIDACHTLPRKPDSSSPPGIIVKFVRRLDAECLLSKKREKKDLSTRHLGLSNDHPIYINESLSPARRRLLALARQARRKHGYKWLWVRGGKIFIRKDDNGPVTVVKSQADLDE
jgi:hypothetical protein